MMRSNNNPLQYTNSDEDEDEFAPNPFRSGASVTSNGSADFLDSPSNNNTMNHPNQPTNYMQQGAPYGQQQPQLSHPLPPQQQHAYYGVQGQQQPQSQTQTQQQQPHYYLGGQQPHQPPQQYVASSMTPDPNSGMTGTLPLDYQHRAQQQQFQQQRAPPPPVLTGIMDQNAGSFHNTTNNISANSGNTNSPQPAAPVSLFSIRGLTNLCCRSDQAILLFNVDTIDIYLRLKASLMQFHQPDQFRTNVIGDLVAQAAADAGHLPAEQAAVIPVSGDRKGPDLYGPFWLSMTLVFVLGVAANLSDYLHHQRRSDPDEEFEYDINHLLHAMYIVFGYSFAVPTIFWFACQCLALPAIPWAMWVCCYGYSLTAVLVGALVAWWLPYELWHWLVLGLASAASGLLLVRNLSTPLLGLDHAKAAPVLLAILAAHVIDFLVLKITFFP